MPQRRLWSQMISNPTLAGRKLIRLYRLRRPPAQDVELLQSQLTQESRLSLNYLALVVGSCVIATLGLIANSPAVIIGAMIIAPLMLPIRGIALGALDGNVELFQAGLISVVIGTLTGIGMSFSIGRVVDLPTWGSEILARTQPNLLDLGVALAAGMIGAFARVRPQIADSLAGVAISVALMPPVCVIGLGLSQVDWTVSQGATLLYLTNLLGICFACMVTFLAMGYIPLSRARSVLISAAALVGLLVLPLGASLTRLLTQAQLESALRTTLLRGTITFQRVELLNSAFNWSTYPPEVTLVVRSSEPVTPKQVNLLESFVSRQLSQPFRLFFEVTESQSVRSTIPVQPTSTATPSPSPSPTPILTPIDPTISPDLLLPPPATQPILSPSPRQPTLDPTNPFSSPTESPPASPSSPTVSSPTPDTLISPTPLIPTNTLIPTAPATPSPTPASSPESPESPTPAGSPELEGTSDLLFPVTEETLRSLERETPNLAESPSTPDIEPELNAPSPPALTDP